MLVSRHRIGEYMPGVVHQGSDPAAIAVCREIVEESQAQCVILHGSRGWGGWDEQSDLNLIVIHDAATDGAGPGAALGRAMERHYRDSGDEQTNLKHGAEIVTLDHYHSRRRTLNHHMARAARHGLIFPREPGTEDRYRHDGDTSNEWELVTTERLEMAAMWDRSVASLRASPSIMDRLGPGHHCPLDVNSIEGRTAHMLLWQSGAALLSILGVVYPMRSVEEMARLIGEREGVWNHEFQSGLDQLDQYAECGCELVVTDPVRDLPELWRGLEIDRDALRGRIRELCGYDLARPMRPGE